MTQENIITVDETIDRVKVIYGKIKQTSAFIAELIEELETMKTQIVSENMDNSDVEQKQEEQQDGEYQDTPNNTEDKEVNEEETIDNINPLEQFQDVESESNEEQELVDEKKEDDDVVKPEEDTEQKNILNQLNNIIANEDMLIKKVDSELPQKLSPDVDVEQYRPLKTRHKNLDNNDEAIDTQKKETQQDELLKEAKQQSISDQINHKSGRKKWQNISSSGPQE